MKHLPAIAGIAAGMLFLGTCADDILAQTPLETRQAMLSRAVNTGDRVGRMRFLGMLELPEFEHDGLRLSQLSGLAWDDDDGVLYALSDKGGLFHLQVIIENDRLTGVKLLRAVPLRELGSGKPLRGWRIDAEGLDIANGRNGRRGDAELFIGLERLPQIMRYRPDGYATGRDVMPEPINQSKAFRDPNKMLESVCLDPAHGVLTMPEIPLRNERDGYNRIFSLAGPSWLYPSAPGERITAMECLGRGEVLVLQQNYQYPFGRIVVTLKRLRLPSAPDAGTLSPETVVTLDTRDGFLIDNFEGLARHRGNRFFMVSDNNDLFIQRTLLMYFELPDN